MFSTYVSNHCRQLGDLFNNNERISSLLHELDNLKLEQQHFIDSNPDSDFYENKRLLKLSSSVLMGLWQTLQHKYNRKEKLGFITSIRLIFAFGIKSFKFWDINPEKIIFTIKRTYYIAKLKEVSDELEVCRAKKFDIVPDDVYKESLDFLKSCLYKRYKKSDGKKRPLFKDSKDVFHKFHDFQKEYPIILSTTFSSRNCVPFSDPDALYDYVIMDEASQVDVVTGALAMSCARNTVIVGDKMQLPNVITDEKRKLVTDVFNQCNGESSKDGSVIIDEGYNFVHSFLESVEMLFPETPQTLLREHYRCHPKIINFCNQKFYGGRLLIMTKDNGEDDVLTAIKTVPGNHCSNMYNQRQIDVIKEEIMPVLAEKGVKADDIGIVAPYNNQVNQLKAQLPDLDSATVHKFQGREKDSIIISTVDNEITPFTDDAKMLNVAISRAKKQLYIVVSGNEQRSDSNIMELVRYIQYNNFTVEESKVNSIFDYLYSNYTRERFAYLDKIKKISKFDSENLMYKMISDILAEDEFSKYGVVFEMPLNDIVSKSGAAELPEDLRLYVSRSWSHCDFVIYNKVTKGIVCGIEVDGYKYHKSGTEQSVRDRKKDEVFRLIGIPLLRCSTKESGEGDRIRKVISGR